MEPEVSISIYCSPTPIRHVLLESFDYFSNADDQARNLKISEGLAPSMNFEHPDSDEQYSSPVSGMS